MTKAYKQPGANEQWGFLLTRQHATTSMLCRYVIEADKMLVAGEMIRTAGIGGEINSTKANIRIL